MPALGDVAVSAPRTGGEAVVAALKARKINCLFALPGIQLDHLFNALHGTDDWLRVINARHEQGVAYMALGYAQSTGKPGLYAVVPGPGFLNTTAALSTAYAVHAPVLGLIGQIATGEIGVGNGLLHELPDQTAIVRGLTRWNGIAMEPAEVPALMGEAFRALEHGHAPAVLELPADVLAAPCASLPPATSEAAPLPRLDSDAVAAAAGLLAGAKKPLIFVGAGAIDAREAVDAVAQQLGAGVVSHLQGRGIIPSEDPRALGYPEASQLWAEADVILAVGTRFFAPRRRWKLREHQKVIRIDIDSMQFSRGAPPTVAIEADAAQAMDALADALRRMGAHDGPEERKAAAARVEAYARVKAGVAACFERELAPQMAYLRAIRAALPAESIVVADYTQVGYVATAAFAVNAPRQMITPGYQGTLGFAYATALGVKVGNPDTPVVAICGDGGFLFTANEIATAVQHGIAAVALVFTDGAFGNVRRMQEELYGGKVVASELINPDFVRYAESFGAAACRAEGPQQLEDALRWAIAHPGPTLIEVPVGRMPDPWDLLEPPEAR